MTPKELKQAFANLPSTSQDAPLHTWPFHQLQIRQQVADNDPLNLLQWPTINATMHTQNGNDYTQEQFDRLPKSYHKAVKEPVFAGDMFAELVYQSNHLLSWEIVTGKKVSELSYIVEFGGGYGQMALLCRRLGFKGKYTIIDLPEFSLLQQFFLSNTVGLDGFDFVKNYKGKANLFMALYSITEIPVNDRAKVLKKIDFDSCLIAHQKSYRLPSGEMVNNANWSESLVNDAGYNWRRWRNDIIKNHWYIVGEKN